MQLGRYTIEGELGRGGIGVVYRARDPSGREVAIKLLQGASAPALERFAREGRLQEQLGEQEGFVPLLDLGQGPRGPFLVMPLLTGGTLRDRLRPEGLPIDEVVAQGRALAEALGRAHAAGVVHRDVKPDNVLFTGEGRPLVADLGLAKHFRQDVSGASQSVALSRSGEVRGTPAYMAPEQLQDARSVGAPADVYALGCVLYECLTGQQAFDAESLLELAGRIARGDREPVRALRHDAPAWLVAVIDRALATDPERRYPDGAALAAALAAGGSRGGARGLAFAAVGGAALLALGLALARRSTPADEPAPAPSASASPTASSPAPPAPGAHLPARWRALAQVSGARLVEVFERDPSRGAVFALGRVGEQVVAVDAGAVRELRAREEDLVVVAPEDLSFLEPPGAKQTPYVTATLQGGTAATIGADLAVWQVSSGELQVQLNLAPLAQGAGAARHAALDPLGIKALAAVGGRLVVVDSIKRDDAKVVASFPLEVTSLAAGPGRWLAAHGPAVTLHDLAGATLATLEHPRRVAAVAYGVDPQGRGRPLTATSDGELRRWDATGKHGEVCALPLGADGCSALAASPDGAHAALASGGVVRLIDLERGAEALRLDLQPAGEEVSCLAFGPRGRELLVGTRRGSALRFQLELPGVPERGPPRVAAVASWGVSRGRQADPIDGLLALPDGGLISAGRRALTGWDPRSGEPLWQVSTRAWRGVRPAGPGRALSFGESTLQVWDLAQTPPRELRRIGVTSPLLDAAADPSGRRVAMIDVYGRLTVWEVEARRPLRSQVVGRGVALVLLLEDGRLILGGPGGLVRCLDEGWRQLWKSTATHAQRVTALARSRDGQWVLTGTSDGFVGQWSLADGKVRWVTGLDAAVSSLDPGPGNLLVGLGAGELALMRADGETLWKRRAPASVPRAVFVGEDRALVGGLSRRVSLLELASGRELWPAYDGHEAKVAAVALSDDGQRVISVGQEGARVLERRAGQARLHELRRFAPRAYTVALCGERPALVREWGGRGVALARWDPRTTLVKRLPGHAPMTLVASADGSTGAYYPELGQEVVVLDAASGAKLCAVPQRLPVQALAFSADGRLLAILEGAGPLSVWDARTGRRLLGRDVGGAEQVVFVPGAAPRVALTTRGGEAVLLALPDGEERARFYVGTHLAALAATPEGRLLTGEEGGEVFVWELGEDGARQRARLDLGDAFDHPSALAGRGGTVAVGTGKGRVLVFELGE
ncbi:MAG: WD40 repeat domain-containing serine/threonine protein kinase [Planctomycetota bacterium]